MSTLTHELIEWIGVLRSLSLAIFGIVGMTLLLWRYAHTGDVSIPAVGVFTGLVGLNSIGVGKQ